ncbi:MAG: hypothetical protein AABX04_06740 [Nanoarchaeota archaeon]
MANELFYELPQDCEAVAEIVKSIPSTWCWVNGFLAATREMYESGQIAENTRLFISRFYSIKPTIIGVDDVPYENLNTLRDRKQGFVPQISDVVLKGKLVSSVGFDEAGFENEIFSMNRVKELAAEFIQRGYKGWISAYSGYENNHANDNPEKFSLTHSSGKKGFETDSSILPPHVSLQWDPRYGGKRENLDGMVTRLEELGLRSLK